jgi:hypothetical protein
MTAHTLNPIAILSVLGFVLIGGALSHLRLSRAKSSDGGEISSSGAFGSDFGHHGDCGSHGGDCGGGGDGGH